MTPSSSRSDRAAQVKERPPSLRLSVDPAPRFRPLNGWCLAGVAGAALGWFLGGAWWLWLGLATAALLFAWMRRSLAPAMLCLVCLCLMGWRAAEANGHAARFQSTLAALQGTDDAFPLRLTVGDDLRLVSPGPNRFPYARFTARAPAFEDGTPILPQTLMVNWYDRSKTGAFPKPGQTWLIPARPYGTPGAKTLTVTAHTDTATLLRDVSGPTFGQRLARLRAALSANLALGVSPREAHVVQTMTLGSDRSLLREDLQRYADAGIVHILSISGLHVGIVAALIHILLGWTGLGPRLRAALLIPALVGYLLLIGAPPAASRATLMAVIWCLGPCFRRKPDALCSLLLTALLLLAFSPALIADVGALLSFVVMGGILLWMPPLADAFVRLLRAEIPDVVRGGLPLGLSLRRGLALLLAVSAAAWLAALPLCLCFFGRLSLIGLLLNLVLPGLTVPVVWGGLVSALLGGLLPGLAAALNCFNAAILHLVDLAAASALDLPGSIYEAQAMLDPTTALLLETALLLLPLTLQRSSAGPYKG